MTLSYSPQSYSELRTLYTPWGYAQDVLQKIEHARLQDLLFKYLSEKGQWTCTALNCWLWEDGDQWLECHKGKRC